MGLLYFHFENKTKKFFLYAFIFLLNYLLLIFTICKNNFYINNFILIDTLRKIFVIIPYIIYNLCISDKSNWQLTFNFNPKD